MKSSIEIPFCCEFNENISSSIFESFNQEISDFSLFHSFFLFINYKNIRDCVFCERTICFIRNRNVGESDNNERSIDIDCSNVSVLISRQKESGKNRAYNGINEHIIKLHRKPFTRIQLRPSVSRKMINANKDKWVCNI